MSVADCPSARCKEFGCQMPQNCWGRGTQVQDLMDRTGCSEAEAILKEGRIVLLPGGIPLAAAQALLTPAKKTL